MKKLVILLFVICNLFTSTISAQDSIPFKPSGKIIARGFLDYSTGLGHVNGEKGFDITRAFLGYQYQFAKNFTGQVVIDGASGTSSSGSKEVYLRNAFINWKDKDWNINGGLIGLMQFSIQEKYWMHRYVMKSFQDENKMAPSVDLGITAQYKFNDYLSADLSLTNGEGYKKIKRDNNMRYAAGVSLYPAKNTIFRVYADMYNDDESLRDKLPENITATNKDQYSLSVFAGYQDKILSVGAEYNRVFNKGFIKDKDYFGYSFYASARFAPKWRAFGRYDIADSSAPSGFTSPWYDNDGQLVMIGAEFQPLKQLKIAPNLRNLNPSRDRSEQYLFINIEFNL
ncbi:hypothetical protein D0T57_06145 [Dysgonomonas sp. 511]|nr:hypothetical protein [Dysgonomonas sp. 511]